MDNTTLNYWPLLVTLEDVYVPDIADIVIDSIRELDEQLATLTITIAIDAATWHTGRWNRRVGRWK